MNVPRAFLAGVIGGAVMSLGLATARALGIPADFEHILGTLVLPAGRTAFVVGYVMHLTLAGAIGLIYAQVFETGRWHAGAAAGAAFGFAHAIVAGAFMLALPVMHPLIPEIIAAPGPFMGNFGMSAVVAQFAVHILFGATVGVTYAPPSRSHVRG